MTEDVLLVEDNPQNLMLARILLERAGLRVVEAMNGDEARAAVADVLPDVVLLDIGLPGEDGSQIMRALRADDRTNGLPIVAMTAYAMRGDRQRFLSQGFDGYISKPIDPLTFAETVKKHISSAPLARPSDEDRDAETDQAGSRRQD